MAPEPAAGSATRCRFEFLDEDGLRVAGDATGESIRSAERGAEGQHRHRIGATDCSGERRDRAAHDVPVRIALGHHAPGRFGADEGRAGGKPACLLDARPQLPQRAKLGDGEELVLVGGEAEEDQAARSIEIETVLLQGPQISERVGKDEGKLLSLRAAGRMHRPAVGNREGPREAFSREIADQPGDHGRKLGPGHGEGAAHRSRAKRVEAEAYVQGGWLQFLRPNMLSHQLRDLPRGRTEIKLHRDPGIEIDIVEGLADGGGGRRQGIAIVADGALEHEVQAVRAIAQIVEGLRIGGFRVGKVDPLHDGPLRTGRTARDALCALRAGIKRLDGDAVIAFRSERGERRTFERLFHEGLPRRLVGGREVAGKGQFHHSPQALSGVNPLLA